MCHFRVRENGEFGWASNGGRDEIAEGDEAEWTPAASKVKLAKASKGDRGIRHSLPVHNKPENKRRKFQWGEERPKQGSATILKTLIDNQ